MNRKWLLFQFCLSLLFILTPLSRASLTLRVNESATTIKNNEGQTALSLARKGEQEEIVKLLKSRGTRITPALDVLIPQTPGQAGWPGILTKLSCLRSR